MSNQPNQDRLTRRCLIGKGIVCGLDIYVDEDYGVYVRSGNGITSKGRYIEIAQPCWFRYYKEYGDPDNYPFFQDISVWELLKEPGDDSYPLKPQNSEEEQNPFLRNKVVLVYKEKQGGPTRILVLGEDDVVEMLNIDQIASIILWDSLEDDDDFIYNDNYNPDDTRPRIHDLNLAMNPASRLPEIALRRLGFGPGDPFVCPPGDEDPCIFPPILSLDDLYNAYVPIIDEATKALDTALTQIHEQFSALLDWNKMEHVTEWIALLCEKWEAYKQENEEADVSRHYIQYFYGWVCDLTQAYHELRLELINLIADCCDNANEFPRHLLLGIALREDLARQPKPLRHTFRQPPIYNGNADRLQRLRLYCWRVLMMIKEFYLPGYISDPDLNPYCPPNDVDDMDYLDFSKVKITPSRCCDEELGEKTVPFYYPLSLSRFSVHNFWNYHRTKTCSIDQILSYHANNTDDSYTDLPHVINPLKYKFDCCLFFRIEGHVGLPVFDYTDEEGENHPGALNSISYLIQKYNLPIQIQIIGFPLTDEYDYNVVGSTVETYNSFQPYLLGMEHLAGAKACGTFFLVYETGAFGPNNTETQVVVADFFLPKCNANLSLSAPRPLASDSISASSTSAAKIEAKKDKGVQEKAKSPKKASEEKDKPSLLIERLGKATAVNKNDLKKLKGVGPKLEKELNALNIYSFKQLSKITEKEFDLIDDLLKNNSFRGKAERDDWASQAKKLLKNKT